MTRARLSFQTSISLSKPMLDWHLGECMVINDNWRVSQGKRSFYIPNFVIWVCTILSHSDTSEISPRYKFGSLSMVYRPKWYWIQTYHEIPIPNPYQKLVNPCHRWYKDTNNSSPTLVWTNARPVYRWTIMHNTNNRQQ